MKYRNKKEIKKLENGIDETLIDFGNHYVKSVEGGRFNLKKYRNSILDIITKEELHTELQSVVDCKNFIEEIGLTEDLLSVIKDTIKDLEEEISNG